MVGAIEVRIGGATFTCTTVEDAVALVRALGAISPAVEHFEPLPSLAAEPAGGAWRQPRALDVFWGRLNPRGREAIRLIATSGGVSIEQLRERLGLTSVEVSQMLAACKRTATSVGIPDHRDVFTYRMSGARGARVTLYYPGRLLREPEGKDGRAPFCTHLTVATEGVSSWAG